MRKLRSSCVSAVIFAASIKRLSVHWMAAAALIPPSAMTKDECADFRGANGAFTPGRDSQCVFRIVLATAAGVAPLDW